MRRLTNLRGAKEAYAARRLASLDASAAERLGSRCGGKACIDTTRIRVIDVVQAQSEGHTPEQIRNLFAVTLSLAQVYSALAYADEHPQEIAADFASEASAEAEIDALRAQHLGRRGQ